jgi:hypothetical protein
MCPAVWFQLKYLNAQPVFFCKFVNYALKYSVNSSRYLCLVEWVYMYCFSFEEESSLSSCTEVLKMCNSDVVQNTAQLTAHFVKLSTYVKLLAAQSKC